MKLRLALFCLVACGISPAAWSDLVVSGYEPVFKIKLGRYQAAAYRVRIDNTGATLKRVRGRLIHADEAGDFSVFGSFLWFGKIDALQSQHSLNSFIVVAPRSLDIEDQLLEESLQIDYRFLFDVTLTGQVIDEPIPNAIVTADVGGDTTEVVADTAGNFTVDLSLASFDDFVTLDAVGGPGQEFVALRSLAGTALELHDATGIVGGASLLAADQVQSLDVTHLTTAKAVLAEAVNGGPIESRADLAAAELGIDTFVLLRIATTIKVIIDEATVSLPAGFSTTLELVQNLAAAEAFAAELQADNASAYNAAQAATLAGAASGGFAASDVDGAIYSTILRNLGVIVGERLLFNADGTAQRTDASGTLDATWSISPEGTLLFEPVGGQFIRPAEGFTFSCAPIVNTGVRTQTVYLGSEFNLVLRGGVLDLVTERSEQFQQFPDNPECPPTAPTISEPTIAFRWLSEEGTVDYTESDFAGQEVVLNFWSDTDTRAPLGNAINTTGQDFFSFSADGTGSTRITGRAFTWSIDADGHLEIAMVTGELNEYTGLGMDIDGDVMAAINVGTTANGTFAFRSLQLATDPRFVFSPANVAGPPPREFISGQSEQNTLSAGPTNTRVYRFDPDGSYIETIDSAPLGVADPTWNITPDGRLVLDGQFNSGFFRRQISWAPVAIIGDRYWVVDARQLGNAGDPGFVDLGTVTGFLTYYRLQP